MGLTDQLGKILGRYTGQGGQREEEVHGDFDRVASQADSSHIAEGLAATFRSDQTPAFPDMLGQMFGQASGAQRAGLLNTLMGALGPGAAGQVLSGLGGPATGGGEL